MKEFLSMLWDLTAGKLLDRLRAKHVAQQEWRQAITERQSAGAKRQQKQRSQELEDNNALLIREAAVLEERKNLEERKRNALKSVAKAARQTEK